MLTTLRFQSLDLYNQSERSSTHLPLSHIEAPSRWSHFTYLEANGMSSLVLHELDSLDRRIFGFPRTLPIVAFLLPIPAGSLASYRRTDAATIKTLPCHRQSPSVLVAQRCWSVEFRSTKLLRMLISKCSGT